jgi:hypothetical protein
MKRAAVLLAVLVAACGSSRQAGDTHTISQPGHGAISLQIVPNPIVATNVGGNNYEFPFQVIVRETGGHAVNVTRVSADVYALGTLRVAQESYDAARLASLGYSTSLPANGQVQYSFRPRKEVTDDRLFGGVTAELRVDAVDDTGTATTASTTVTVRR